MLTRPCYERLATWHTPRDGRLFLLMFLAMRNRREGGTLDRMASFVALIGE